jgi:hypothetical protein
VTVAVTPSIAVTLSPNAAQTAVAGGAALALSATISNDTSNQGASWSLSPASGCGALSATSGLAVNYAPPASLSQPCTASITVASVADSTRRASVTVAVTPSIAVTLSPNTAQNAVAGGASLALSAVISNDTSNQGASWSLSPASGCGALSATIGLAVNYAPPASLSQPCTASITVASVADSTKRASVTVAVTPSIAVTLSPNAAQAAVAGGAALALSAVISNDASNQGVSWSLSPASGCGALSATSGLAVNYAPPASLSQPCTASITVASVADSTKRASVTVAVTPSIAVTLSPNTAQNVMTGATLALSASVGNDPSNQGLQWSLNPSSGCGTLSTNSSQTLSVTYGAPKSPDITTPCTVTVSVTAKADSTKSASLEITVVPISVNMSPDTAQAIATSTTVGLTASVLNDASNSGAKWSLSPASGCGSLSASSGTSVVFTAPTFSALSAACTVTATAASSADSTKSASIPITVNLLSTWFNGGIAGKKIIYWGNSTVAANFQLFRSLGANTVPGGALEGVEFRTDLLGVQCDAIGNVTITLSGPSNYQVGQWVSVWFANPYHVGDFWLPSVQVSAVSGNTFSYVRTGAPQTSFSSDWGYVTGSILNFGNNGASLAAMLAGQGPYPIQLVCTQQPDLLIMRGPLINDVRLGRTDLAEATSLEQAALQTLQQCSPQTAVLLTTENSLLSTDTGEHWVQPNADAQEYTDIMHDAVMAMNEQFPNVEVLDIMSLVYGTTVQASSAYMINQLHESDTGAALEIQAIIPVIGMK